MRYLRSCRSFVAGIVLGILIGSAGVGAASMGYKAWNGLSQDYKIGYVTGFLAMARLARNLQPGGYIDSRYPEINKAKPVEWANVVDELYADPKNRDYTINSIMQSAAHRLEEKYGPPLSPHERTRRRMQQQLQAVRKNLDKKTETMPSGQEKTVVEAPPKEVPPPSSESGEVDPAPKKKQKKWCRCDGTDFREARRQRQAAAAAKKEEADDKPGSGSSGQ